VVIVGKTYIGLIVILLVKAKVYRNVMTWSWLNHGARRIISRSWSMGTRIVVAKFQMRSLCLWLKVKMRFVTKSMDHIIVWDEALQEEKYTGLINQCLRSVRTFRNALMQLWLMLTSVSRIISRTTHGVTKVVVAERRGPNFR